jgi:O-antigen ligase
VFASGSRSSLLGSAVALLVYVVMRPGLGVLRSARRLVALVVATAVLGISLAATGNLPTTLEERINRSLDTTDPAARAHLVADRENLMDAGFRAFEESPLIGTGLDNFRYVTQRYDVEATPQLPHNLWLQLLVQVGLVGTAAFALYLACWGVEMWRSVTRLPRPDGHLTWGLLAAVTGVLTVFMFAPELLDRHYWLLVALGLAVLRGAAAGDTTKGPAHP